MSKSSPAARQNAAVKRRACARGSFLAGQASIFRAKFSKKTLESTVSRKVCEKNRTFIEIWKRKRKYGKEKLKTFPALNYGILFLYRFFWALSKKLYCFTRHHDLLACVHSSKMTTWFANKLRYLANTTFAHAQTFDRCLHTNIPQKISGITWSDRCRATGIRER